MAPLRPRGPEGGAAGASALGMGGDDDAPRWTADVPRPEVSIDYEDGVYRAELTNYVRKGDRVKDIRVRGPARSLRREAKKDAAELRKAAYCGGSDPALFHVRLRRKELETIKWKKEDLKEFEDVEEIQNEPPKTLAQKRQEEQRKREEEARSGHSDVLLRLAAADKPSEAHKPVGPNWKRPGSMTQLPQIEGHPSNSWFIHEKQDSSGKYRAWLFFNSSTGKYYAQKGTGYLQVGVPNSPQDYPVSVRVGSANLSSRSGKKLDMAVVLPELHKTGFMLKQALDFFDKPASLFVLCDGLRNVAAASEFCARKLHTLLLPKLSARASEWEDFELTDLLRDVVEALDALLLSSPASLAGCSLAVGLVAGTRLVLGALGGVRCIVCRPPTPEAAAAAKRIGISGPAPWTSQLLAGGDAHTIASEEERLRIESVSGRLVEGPPGMASSMRLSPVSARPAALAAIADDRERLLAQIARAANPFATLGLLAPEELRAGRSAIRTKFRKCSLAVHPDKWMQGEALRPRAMAAFAKLEAAASAIEAMLQADAGAPEVLAGIDLAHDAGRLVADPSAAARLLGVEEGCTEKSARQAVERRFHAPLSCLQGVCPKDVERALRTLEVAEEAAVRGTALWAPPEADEAVAVTRALGCRDLKAPTALLSATLHAECIELQPGSRIGVALLSDALSSVSDEAVAKQLAAHSPSRPRAAALRLALSAAAKADGAAIGAICAFLDFEAPAAPSAKRAKMAKPDRVRISHILLRWAGLKGEDEFARPNVPPPTRTQLDAERELLELLEELSLVEPKALGARFKKEVLLRSECSSALNVPYADLGWIDAGGAEPALEAAAFAAPTGGLSDIVVSTRGVHLMYRLA